VKDKRVTKFLIVATVLIVTIASTTIKSDFALAARQAINSSGDAILTISNIVRVNCHEVELRFLCPSGSIMIISVRVLNHPEIPVFNFAAGPCCAMKTTTFSIPVGASYEVTTIVNPTSNGPYRYQLANIIFKCVGINSCVSIMSASGAKVEVNYHWECDALICAIPIAQLDRIPPQTPYVYV
jgi:hypothetical protein